MDPPPEHSRQYNAADRTDQWLQIMSPAGENGLDLRQDARVLVARLTPDHRLAHSFGEGRGGSPSTCRWSIAPSESGQVDPGARCTAFAAG
ncbi:hypothetical protein GCM10011608_42040 [Micromonospora sonchi]|uniref:Uncharacterized protein n=1 Tax=Micromonospora sonchi TaxID=1763543 RepID=A0A917X1F5_9ACTN|nr:hypothetical protein GCM10011608_42040 [Micromonospora sonchi]